MSHRRASPAYEVSQCTQHRHVRNEHGENGTPPTTRQIRIEGPSQNTKSRECNEDRQCRSTPRPRRLRDTFGEPSRKRAQACHAEGFHEHGWHWIHIRASLARL